MQAVVIDRYGGNEVVHVREMPPPQPGAGQVQIRVRAAGVNPVDWKIRQGQLRLLTGRRFPKILGRECAGEITAVGAGVQRFQSGEQVIACPGVRRLGAYAEYVCAGERNTFLKTAAVPFEQAATLPIAGCTALQALRDRGRLAADQQVLINGASGGVGTFAVQIARHFGATVTAVCRAANHPLVRDLGAHRVIDYTREDFTRGEHQYDLIFDAVAKSSFRACKPVLAPRGIYVVTLPSPGVFLNQYLTGWFTRKQARLIMVKAKAADLTWLQSRIEAGEIRAVIDRRHPLAQVREAFAYSESGQARGKIVLTVG